MSADKKGLFLNFWRMLAPAELRDLSWVPEYRFAQALGRRYRFDYALPAAKVAVEVDGGQWAAGGGRHAKDGDREKLNLAASLGWCVFRFSPRMLDATPNACVSMVVSAIGQS